MHLRRVELSYDETSCIKVEFAFKVGTSFEAAWIPLGFMLHKPSKTLTSDTLVELVSIWSSRYSIDFALRETE